MAGHVKTPVKTSSEIPKRENSITAAVAFAQDDPHVGALVPRAAAVVAEHRVDREPGALELARHLRHGQRAERQLEAVLARLAAAARST